MGGVVSQEERLVSDVVGVHSEARVSVRSGEGESEEWRCLLVARLKVCSVTERGVGGGRTSSRWLGSGGGWRSSGGLARIGSFQEMPHSVLYGAC